MLEIGRPGVLRPLQVIMLVPFSINAFVQPAVVAHIERHWQTNAAIVVDALFVEKENNFAVLRRAELYLNPPPALVEE